MTIHPRAYELSDEAEQHIRDFRTALRLGDTQRAVAHKNVVVSLMEWASIFATHPQAAEASYESARKRMEAEHEER